MKQSKQSSNAASSVRKSPALASLALACVMATTATNANASDVPAFGQRAVEFIKNIFREIETYKSYADTAQGWKDQLMDPSKLWDSAVGELNPYDVKNAAKRPLSYGADRCEQGSSSGFSVKDIMGGLGLTGTNFVDKQKQICIKIVTVENAKYNTLIDSLKLIGDAKANIKAVTDSAKASNTPGQGASGTINAVAQSMEIERLHAEMHTQALLYDSIIATLNQDMTDVAKEAMDGKKKNFAESLLSTGISLTTLKLTLNGLKSSCPAGFNCD